MKAHKNWGIGALLFMLMAVLSGYSSKLKETHHVWAFGSLGCMLMAVFTGYKMTHRKPAPQAEESPEPSEEPVAEN